MNQIYSILRALSLVILLGLSSLALSSQFKANNDQYPWVEVSSNYVWDFSSGLTLAQGIGDEQHNPILFGTEGILIDAVVGESPNIEVTCEPDPCDNVFAYAGHGIPIYAFQTQSVFLYWNMEANGWTGKVSYNTTSFGWKTVEFILETVNLSSISEAMIQDLQSIGILQHVNESTFGEKMVEQIHVNNTKINFDLAFDDGTYLRLEIVNGLLFLTVSQFEKYYFGSQELAFEQKVLQEYYVGEQQNFLPNTISAVNLLIGALLEV